MRYLPLLHTFATILGPSAACPHESTTSMLFRSSSGVMIPFAYSTRMINDIIKENGGEFR